MGKALIIKGADFSTNGIPAEFTRLAWIGGATASNSYINSGVFWGNKENSMDDELQFYVKLDATGLTSGNDNFLSPGAYINVNTGAHAWFRQTGTTFYFAKGSEAFSNIILFDGNWHTVSISKTKITVDGTDYQWATAPGQYDGSSSSVYDNIPIYLDSTSRSSGDGYNSYIPDGDGHGDAMEIGWVRYYRSGSLILDCVPVKRKSDNKICFFDRVSGEYKMRNDGSTPQYGLT